MLCSPRRNSLIIFFSSPVTGPLRAATQLEVKCAEEERQGVLECKKQYPMVEKLLKRACCASFAVEKCIINSVDEDCKPFLNERYQNSPLRKGDCKPFYDKCDSILSTSTLSTTHQPPPESYEKPKPENLKQSISQSLNPSIPQSPAQPENHNLIAEEQKTNGVLASGGSVLLMLTCGSLVMVKHLLNRQFN